jgi:xylulose-5-phosphate/fructose-6-phosphate phosphoketolase
MNVRNGTSRYHLITQAIRLAAANNPRVAARASERVHHYEYVLADHRRYIQENGVDPEEIMQWHWS